MSERPASVLFAPRMADWIPGGRLVGGLLPAAEEADLMAIKDELAASGEDLSGGLSWFRRQFADPALIHGLREAEQRTGIPVAEFIKNSLRYSLLDRTSILNGHAVIAQSTENVHQDGRPRRP